MRICFLLQYFQSVVSSWHHKIVPEKFLSSLYDSSVSNRNTLKDKDEVLKIWQNSVANFCVTMSINTISCSVKYGLYFAASWPGMSLVALHRICLMIILIVFQIYQYSYVVYQIRYKTSNLPTVIDDLSICIPFTLVGIKLIMAWINSGCLCEILRTMEEECKKYAAIDTQKLIQNTARLSYRLTTMVICVTVSSTAFYLVGVFVHPKTNETTSRELLLKMNLPFDIDKTPIYVSVLIAQYIYQASSAFTFSVFSTLLLMVVLHIGCQVDIICRMLLESSRKNKQQLRFFISRHQDIIVLTERIESFFTYTALSQLVLNTLNICCLGYLIITALDANDGYAALLKCVLFYVAVLFDPLIYCFAGEYLNTKSKLISATVYNYLWYDLQPNESQLLLLILLRSQRGLNLTFGKFANLSMECFSSIMKASGSYMSLLLAVS